MGIEISREKLNRNIFVLAWPAVLENLLQTGMMFADTLMVSRLGTTPLAAVGLSNMLVFIFLSTFGFPIRIVATALVARYAGAKEDEEARSAGGKTLTVGIGLGFLITVAGLLLSEKLLVATGVEPEVLRVGSLYMRIVFSFTLFRFITLTGSGILRGGGDSRTPMLIILAANSLNVLLNWLLIFGVGPFPRMEVTGAGLATGLSVLFGGFLTLFILSRGISVVRLSLRNLRGFDIPLLKKIGRLFLPASLEHLVLRVGMFLFMRIVVALGTISLAAHQIGMRIESLSFMIGVGFSVASATLVGQSLGAKKPALAGLAMRRIALYSVFAMFLLALAFVSAPGFLVGLFSPEKEVFYLASLCVIVCAFEQSSIAILMVLTGGLQGAGDTVSPMVVSFVGALLVRIPLVYILAIRLEFGLIGVWMGSVFDWSLRAAAIYGCYRFGRWRRISL